MGDPTRTVPFSAKSAPAVQARRKKREELASSIGTKTETTLLKEFGTNFRHWALCKSGPSYLILHPENNVSFPGASKDIGSGSICRLARVKSSKGVKRRSQQKGNVCQNSCKLLQRLRGWLLHAKESSCWKQAVLAGLILRQETSFN